MIHEVSAYLQKRVLFDEGSNNPLQGLEIPPWAFVVLSFNLCYLIPFTIVVSPPPLPSFWLNFFLCSWGISSSVR